MNLYNEDENKNGMPILPKVGAQFKKTSAFGKSPLLSRATGGIMERLKNLSRKDMAFVGIGLSVLVMAPVAEYMMSRPATDNLLAPGFGSREGSGANGLYEPGLGSMSQGSPDGSGEVITPLSSRDPASLILGSQPAQPMMAPVSAPPTTFRDSMKDVGRSAFSEASKSAGAPTPIPKMQAAMRSMGSFFSGGEGTRTAGSLSGGKIIDDAKSASKASSKRSMVGPVAMAGYKGVASNTPNSSSKGAFEKLRSQADKSAGNFSGDSAIRSLDKAAADALDIGAGGGGLGSGRDSDKTTKPSNSTNKYEHNKSGESLEEMAAKQRMQKALDWEFFKQYEIPKQIINAILAGITGPLTDFVKGAVGDSLGLNASSPPSYCWQPAVCPTGDCAAKMVEYKKAAPVDLCYDPGAQKFTWESAGKDKGSGAQVNCICGKQNKPIGKEYTPGGVPPGGNPPVVNPGTNPTTDPVTNPVDAAKLFSEYDAALTAIKNSVIVLEQDVTAAKPETEIKPKLDALVKAFDDLNGQAAGSAKNAMLNTATPVKTALTSYKGVVTAKLDAFAKTEGNYEKYLAATKKIETDLAAGKLKVKISEGIERDASANSAAIKAIIAKHAPDLAGNVVNGNTLLTVHTTRITAYTEQMKAVERSAGAIVAVHAEIAPAVKTINETAVPSADKLSQITGRPKLGGAAGVAADTTGGVAKSLTAPIASEVGTFVKDATEQALGEGAPLTKAVVKIRALNWEKFWAPKDSAFDDSAAKAAEAKAWETFDGGIYSGKPVTIADPANFVANAARSAAVQTGLTGSSNDFSNIESIAATIEADVKLAKAELGRLVDPCYFADGGCTGGTPGSNEGGNGTGTPVAGLTDVSGTAASMSSDMATQVADAQARYDAVAKSGKCTSATCKQYLAAAETDLKYMKEYQAKVGQLQTEMAKTNPPVTAERVAQIKTELADIKGKMDMRDARSYPALFDTNIKKAAELAKIAPVVTPVTPVKPPVKPPKPPVVNTNIPKAPEAINNVHLVDAKKRVPVYAYDDNDNIVYQQRCKRIQDNWWPKADTCLEYYPKEPVVLRTVKGFVLTYKDGLDGNSVNVSVSNKDATRVKFLTDPRGPMKIDEYEMQAMVLCEYSSTAKKWIIKKAELRSGMNASSDTAGLSVTAGGDIGLVKVSATASYSHTWSHFRNGTFKDQPIGANNVCK